jgi:hypothetical protein
LDSSIAAITTITTENTHTTDLNSLVQFLSHKNSNKTFAFSRIYASVEESMKGTSSGLCTIQLRGLDIKNVEPGLFGLGRSDPFFELSRKNVDHAAGVVRWYVGVRFVLMFILKMSFFLTSRVMFALFYTFKGILCFVHNTSAII